VRADTVNSPSLNASRSGAGNWPSISRDDSTTPPASNTTWFVRTATLSEFSSDCPTMRLSSCSARAGTFASKDPSSGDSSFVSLTDSR
jgi:hypothetical protein